MTSTRGGSAGFTTIKRVPLWDGKRRAMGIFSGDTVMDASCWGDRTLKDAFTRHLLFLWLTFPGTPLYWLLISKGYKTYMLLVNNFVDYHPRPDGRVDQRLQRLVRDYTDQLFPGKYDEARGVLDFGEGSQRLREEVAPITAEMRLQNPAINYFEQRNPGWRLGHELPCIARISIRLLKPYLLKERRKSAAAVVSRVRTCGRGGTLGRQRERRARRGRERARSPATGRTRHRAQEHRGVTALPARVSAACRRASHGAASLTCRRSARAFERALAETQATQLANLDRILGGVAGTTRARRLGLRPGLGAAAFRERVPETTYADVAESIERQRSGARGELTAEACDRYQPTSGSSAQVKWIPYTGSFLAQLDAAISPWGFDLYRRIPGIRRGRHYWSLSWLPTSLRAATSANVNDDRALLSPSKRAFLALAAPVPTWVASTDSSEDSIFATTCFLAAAEDLTLLSVWSPTFALHLFERLADQRDAIADVLDRGAWDEAHRHLPDRPPRSPRAARLLRSWRGEQDPAFFRELWPLLALVSAWDTASSARWAAKLARLLPHATFQGKGLWATEGVVTIPYQGRYPLAVRSHYFEFVDTDSGQACFAWELRRGQTVRPLLTTGSGLLRYGLDDRLVVRDFLGTTPCFEYLGRIEDVDMVGEKMSPDAARAALEAIAADDTCRPLSLLAVSPTRETDKPRYVALCEGRPGPADERRGALLDQSLRGAFHYNLARDLGQLAAARVLTVADARRLYQDIGAARGMVTGNIKLEPLLLCEDARSAALIGVRLPGAVDQKGTV